MTDDGALLPAEFAELEPFAATWCLATEGERYAQRLASTMDELQAFYDAVMPRAEAAIAYCDAFPLDELPDDAQHLLQLALLAGHGVVPGGGVAPAAHPGLGRRLPRPAGRAAPVSDLVSDPIVLRADRWVDVDAGEVRSPAVVVVEGDRIAAVNPTERAEPGDRDRPRRRHAPARADGHGAQHAPRRSERREPAQRRPGRPRVPHVARHPQLPHDAARRVHHRAQPRPVREDRRLPARRRARRARSTTAGSTGPRLVPAGHAITPTGGHLDPTMFQRLGARHHAAQRRGGHRQRRARGAQGRPLPDQVRRAAHQDLRVGRRDVAQRSRGRAAVLRRGARGDRRRGAPRRARRSRRTRTATPASARASAPASTASSTARSRATTRSR